MKNWTKHKINKSCQTNQMCLFIKNSQFSSQEKLIALNCLDLTGKTGDAGKRGTGRDGEFCSLLGSTGLWGEPLEPYWVVSLTKPEGCRRRLVSAAREASFKLTVQRARDQQGSAGLLVCRCDRSTSARWPHTATIHQGDTNTKKRPC